MQSVKRQCTTLLELFTVVRQSAWRYANELGLLGDTSFTRPLNRALGMEMQSDWPMHKMPPLNPVIAAPTGCFCKCVCCVYELKKATNLRILGNNWTWGWCHGMMPHTVFPQALMIWMRDEPRGFNARGAKHLPQRRLIQTARMHWAFRSVFVDFGALATSFWNIIFELSAILLIGKLKGERKRKGE